MKWHQKHLLHQQLAFIQCKTGEFQKTSFTMLDLGGLILQFRAFKIENSTIEVLA